MVTKASFTGSEADHEKMHTGAVAPERSHRSHWHPKSMLLSLRRLLRLTLQLQVELLSVFISRTLRGTWANISCTCRCCLHFEHRPRIAETTSSGFFALFISCTYIHECISTYRTSGISGIRILVAGSSSKQTSGRFSTQNF